MFSFMLGLLIFAVVAILTVRFWRIFLPLAVIGIVGFVVVFWLILRSAEYDAKHPGWWSSQATPLTRNGPPAANH